MADGRRNNGGHSTKGFAGRKSKAEELGLVAMMEEIKPTREIFEFLAEQIEDDEVPLSMKIKCAELWAAYAVGKPKETVKQTTTNKVTITSDTSFKIP